MSSLRVVHDVNTIRVAFKNLICGIGWFLSLRAADFVFGFGAEGAVCEAKL